MARNFYLGEKISCRADWVCLVFLSEWPYNAPDVYCKKNPQ